DRGPLLLCVNHPNNLIDSLVVGSVLRRKVHYLATAAMFRNRPMARFLLAAGAIPVYRKQDDPDKMDRNTDTFAACYAAFGRGRVVAIYPEGTTHAEARVQRIKTGAARIALTYEGEHPGELTMIPVGLSFEARKSFRSRVLVAFGEPIQPAAYLTAWHEDPMKAVDALTRDLQWAMEGQVVNVERIDDQQLLHAIEELYRDELAAQVMESRGLARRDVDPVRLSRSIAGAVQYFKALDPLRIEALWQRIQAYRALLAQYHLRDEAVRARREKLPARTRVVYSWDAVAGFPFFGYGAVVNGLPGGSSPSARRSWPSSSAPSRTTSPPPRGAAFERPSPGRDVHCRPRRARPRAHGDGAHRQPAGRARAAPARGRGRVRRAPLR